MENSSPRRVSFGDREIVGLWRALRTFVRRRVRRPDQAEDIVQETWLRALKASPEEHENTQAWLRVVAQRLILDETRSQHRRVERERAAARPDHVVPIDAELSNRVEAVTRALEEMREPYREIIILRFRDGLEVGEIAHQLGRSDGTVRSQLKRGLDLLRERLGASSTDRKRRLPLVFLPWWRTSSSRATKSGTGPRWGTWATAACVAVILGSWAIYESRVADAEPPSERLVAIPEARMEPSRSASSAMASVDALDGSGRSSIEHAVEISAGDAAAGARAPEHIVHGRVIVRLDGSNLPGAKILAASENLEAIVELGVSDGRGEFAAAVSKLPTWIWAEHEQCPPTFRVLIDRGFVESGEELVLFTVKAGLTHGFVTDTDGQAVRGARVVVSIAVLREAHRDAQGMLALPGPASVATTDEVGGFATPYTSGTRVRISVTADGFAPWASALDLGSAPIQITLARHGSFVPPPLSDADPHHPSALQTLTTWTNVPSTSASDGSAAYIDSNDNAGNGSISGLLRSPTPRRGPGLELRLDGVDPVSTRRSPRRGDETFEFSSLPAGRYTLWLEGGGAHGSWRVDEIELVEGERRDLGVLIAPAPGSLTVRAKPPGPGEKGPATFQLIGGGATLSAHFRTQGLGIEIDRVAGTIAIHAVWPSEYRLVLGGPNNVDVTTLCEIREARETVLELELEPAHQTFVRVTPARPLREGERWSVFVHSPGGVEELEWMDARFFPLPDGVLSFHAGIAPDVESIEVRTSLGMSGETRLTAPRATSREVVEIELR